MFEFIERFSHGVVRFMEKHPIVWILFLIGTIVLELSRFLGK